MVNFSYLIGDRSTGECLVVDPAYGVGELKAIAEADGMTLSWCARHPLPPGPLRRGHDGHAHRGSGRAPRPAADARARAGRRGRVGAQGHRSRNAATSSSTARATRHRRARSMSQLLHTPGHTPGSQCFLVKDHLVAGDTLFLQGCGRTDLPGGDPAALYESLTDPSRQGARHRSALPGPPLLAEALGNTGRGAQLEHGVQAPIRGRVAPSCSVLTDRPNQRSGGTGVMSADRRGACASIRR